MKQNKHQATFFIILFVVLFGLAITIGIIISNINSSRQETIQIDVEDISNKIISFSSQETHVIDAEITLEITGKGTQKIDKNKIIANVKRIIAESDYDKISEDADSEYIKTEIKNYLKQILPEETIAEIYMTMLVLDDPYSQGTGHKTPESTGETDNSKTMKGLFDKIED